MAADLARRFTLRGYDAVHCAAAAQLDARTWSPPAATGGCSPPGGSCGIATFDPTAPV